MSNNTESLRLNVIDVEHGSEQESDYETAVEMSHWSMSETRVTMQTPYGLTILLTERSESVTHTYLEPDFDEYEESGEIHYLTHRDDTNDRHKTKYRAWVEMPVVSQHLSDLLLNALKSGKIEQIDTEAVDVALQYLHDTKHFGFNTHFLSVGDDWLDAFFATFGRADKGPTIVEMPATLAAEIRRYEDQLREVRAKNREIDIDNAATLAMFEVLRRFTTKADEPCKA